MRLILNESMFVSKVKRSRILFRAIMHICTKQIDIFISRLEDMKLFTIHLPVTNAVEARTQAKIRSQYFFADGCNRTGHAAADAGK
jgi:hypothetical protein